MTSNQQPTTNNQQPLLKNMSLKNTEFSFGWLAKIFHWLVAVLIIGLWIAGNLMTGMENSPFKFSVYGIHKATGIIVLVLAVLAFSWRMMNIKPILPPHIPAWQKHAASIVKYALYACAVGMPLSGWAMSSAAGYPVSIYGLFELPALVEKDDVSKELYRTIHWAASYLLLALFALHAGAALKHHFIHKDGVLRRMLP